MRLQVLLACNASISLFMAIYQLGSLTTLRTLWGIREIVAEAAMVYFGLGL